MLIETDLQDRTHATHERFQGTRNINIFTWSKVDAAHYFEEHILRPANITLEDTLVLANKVRSYGNDRGLFEMLDTSLRINVGSRSPTLQSKKIIHLI